MLPIDKRAVLANHPLFSHLEVAEREQLSPWARSVGLTMARCFFNGATLARA